MKTHLLLLVLCLFVTTACKEKKYYIGVSQISNSDWRQKMNAELMREAQLYENLEIKILSADNDRSRQNQDILQLIEEHIDLLIVTPRDTQYIPAIDEANKKKIPIIVVDRKLKSQSCTSFVGTDNIEIGREAAGYLANELEEGNIVELAGTEGSSSTYERHSGFVAFLASCPKLHLLATVHADWEESIARAKMDSLLSVYPTIDGVYCHNDRMARGAWGAGVLKGRSFKLVGIDALPGKDKGVDMVNRGMMDATFIHPTVGDVIVKLAMRILEGKPYQKKIVPSTFMVDKYNARVMMLQNEAMEEADRKIEMLDGRVKNIRHYNLIQRYFLMLLVAVVLLVVALSLLLYKAYQRSRRDALLLRQKNDQLMILSDELETATNEKLSFFTNVSHEFRTPLTLIAGPVEQLEQTPLTGYQQELTDIIKRNACVLLQLINKVLDLRKLENGKMELRLSEFSFRDSLLIWSDTFKAAALKKKIAMEVEINADDSLVVKADKEKLMSVCFNLLSNALKYTEPNGKIRVEAGNTSMGDGASVPAVYLKVSDTGIGISEEAIHRIFSNYYRVSEKQVGTGLGLALVKTFVELHKGTISLQSELQKGSVFTVVLPKAMEMASVPSWDTLPDMPPFVAGDNVSDASVYDDVDEDSQLADDKRQHLLVIDDNADMCCFIKGILKDAYRVNCASDGKSGLEKALRYLPDLIICDVMMPLVDGFEFLREVKSNVRLSHIPVIMLSACSLENDLIQGFRQGADAYLVKPFNKELLMSRIQNLLATHAKLRTHYADKSGWSGGDTDVAPSELSADKEFLDKLYKTIHDQLGNSELNVDDLSSMLGMSRVQFYRKVKALTHYTPADLLKHIRLTRARYLLENSDKNVTEVAFATGFSSQSYFTKCYKKHFQENPVERKKERKE